MCWPRLPSLCRSWQTITHLASTITENSTAFREYLTTFLVVWQAILLPCIYFPVTNQLCSVPHSAPPPSIEISKRHRNPFLHLSACTRSVQPQAPAIAIAYNELISTWCSLNRMSHRLTAMYQFAPMLKHTRRPKEAKTRPPRGRCRWLVAHRF